MSNRDRNPVDGERRRMLVRLGLVAGMAYAAPVLLRLGTASASSFSAPSRPSFSRPSAPARPRRAAAPAPPPEIVVAAPEPGALDAIAGQGYQLLARAALPLIGAELGRFSLPAQLTLDEARQQILDLVPGALFDLNHVYRPEELACADGSCAAFEMIGWPQGAAGRCAVDVPIGMVDTGVNADHAALEGVDIETLDVLSEGREPASAVHGTAVAILMAGRADTRTPGLLDGARLVAAQAFHRDAAGQDAADAFDAARAMGELVERGMRVVNLSFSGPDNAVLARVVEAALERDVALVAAAGNEGPQADPLFPAAYPGVVAVTAVDGNERVFRQANAGDHIDFAAPGVRVWTAASVSGGRFRSGTSYAAPFVTAMLAVKRTQHPDERVDMLVERLAEGAADLGEPGRDPTFGWGLVQAPAACAGESDLLMPASAR